MRCRTCPKIVRQIEQRHSWKYRQCSECHYLGLKRAYSDLHSNKKKEERKKLKQ